MEDQLDDFMGRHYKINMVKKKTNFMICWHL